MSSAIREKNDESRVKWKKTSKNVCVILANVVINIFEK